jgi:serine/threonine-protein phosphatase 6 regulatory ankyrin repeat subunit B
MDMRKVTKEIGHEISYSQVRSDDVFSPQLIIEPLENVENLGITALWLAVLDGNTDVIKLILKEGVDVNMTITETGGTTVLWEASYNGHTDVVKLLLKKDAEVNMKTISTTALWVASQNGHTDVVKLLLKKDAEVNTKKPPTV